MAAQVPAVRNYLLGSGGGGRGCCQSSACAKSGVFFIDNQKNCQLTMFLQKEQILSAFHCQLTANKGQALVAMNLVKLSVLCFNVQMLVDYRL